MKTYLVTGATGVVGSAVVEALVRAGDVKVFLLVRADSQTHLSERMQALLGFWGLPRARDDEGRYELVPLRGDVSEPRLGLDEPSYCAVSGSCSHIIHAAGAVRMNLPVALARRSAVGGAKQVVGLARRSRNLEKVEMVSTVGVGGRYPGPVPETWLGPGIRYHNTYEQAKAEAETVIKRALGEGLPITVHRPSMVVGESSSGKIIHFQVFYHLCEFLSGRRTFGLRPVLGNAQLDTVPVDYVADALVWASRTPEVAGRVMHLCSGPRVAVTLEALTSRVRRMFRERGIRMPRPVRLRPPMFRALVSLATVFMNQRNKRAARTLPIFLDYLSENQAFDNRQSYRLLSRAGMALPRPEAYLDVVIGRYLDKKYRKNVPSA